MWYRPRHHPEGCRPELGAILSVQATGPAHGSSPGLPVIPVPKGWRARCLPTGTPDR
jgi:hypothetical protein